MDFYFLALIMLILGAILSIFVKEDWKIKVCSIFTFFATILMAVPALIVLLTRQSMGVIFEGTKILGKVAILIDPLSAFFVLVISVMSFMGIIYANGYMKHYYNKGMNVSSHCFFLMLLVASMLGVVTVNNALLFLIIWEVMSLSSFFLVIFEGKNKEVLRAGIKYLIYMHISVIFIMLAFALMNIHSGSLCFLKMFGTFEQNSLIANSIFLLAFAGFGIKAGFVPFHNWLPDAHPAAPTHVSAIMSGVMIKTGIYGILRTLYIIGLPSKMIAYTVLVVSVISALYGVLYAITQHDIKRLLAYHSIENIGIIGIGIGTGMLGLAYNNLLVAMLGFAGGIFHVLNHSIFKELLFFAAGNIYLKAHTRNIEALGGLIKKMPWTALLFIVGSVAICGIPPFNGFVSEFLIYVGMLSGIPASDIGLFLVLILSIAGLGMVGTMAILCFTKASGIMFLGNPRTDLAKNVEGEAPKVTFVPMGILGILTLVIGLFPLTIMPIILSPALTFTNSKIMYPAIMATWVMVGKISLFFVCFAVFVGILCLVRYLVKRKSEKHSTWGCGYNRPNNNMQYTAASYADLFISTLKPLFKRVSHIKKPKEIFPKEAYYEVEIEDIEEAYVVKPIVDLDEKFLTKFERIQNGNIQKYILFGLVFLILSIVGLICFGG